MATDPPISLYNWKHFRRLAPSNNNRPSAVALEKPRRVKKTTTKVAKAAADPPKVPIEKLLKYPGVGTV